jgi:hypothetical protein
MPAGRFHQIQFAFRPTLRIHATAPIPVFIHHAGAQPAARDTILVSLQHKNIVHEAVKLKDNVLIFVHSIPTLPKYTQTTIHVSLQDLHASTPVPARNRFSFSSKFVHSVPTLNFLNSVLKTKATDQSTILVSLQHILMPANRLRVPSHSSISW